MINNRNTINEEIKIHLGLFSFMQNLVVFRDGKVTNTKIGHDRYIDTHEILTPHSTFSYYRLI